MNKNKNLTVAQVKEILSLKKYDFVCPHCEKILDEDDYDFAWETGVCQYCFKPLYAEKIK